LCLTAQEFLIQDVALKNIPAQRIKTLRKMPALSLRRIEERKYSTYAPTIIWQTRYSEFWQWQRVSEWHRQYGQDEITNKKRHILM
jgi:hypothetical protein